MGGAFSKKCAVVVSTGNGCAVEACLFPAAFF